MSSIPIDEPAAPARLQSGIMRAATIILIGNILSRFIGAARDIVITSLFGTGANVSGYLTALIVQTSVYDLLVSGVISAAFIPVFSELRDRREELGRVGSSVVTAAVVAMGVATLLIEILAVPLTALLNGGGDPAIHRAAAQALRIMAPTVIFLGTSGVLTALLYAKQRFIYPAFTPVIFNTSIVLAALVLRGPIGYKAMAVGVLAGGLGQVLLQSRGLHGIHLRPFFDAQDRYVRRIGRLYVPVFLGLIITESQVYLDLALKNSTGPHSTTWLDLGTKIYQLPLGIVATAMSLASLPTLSVVRGREFSAVLIRGLKVVAMLIVPSVIILAIFAQQILTLYALHGKVQPWEIPDIVAGLHYYLPGLGFAAVDQLLIFAFYARNDTVTPVLVGLVSIAGYGIAALISLGLLHLGFRGLALADSVKQIAHATILFILLWRLQGTFAGFGMLRSALQIAAAAAVCVAVCLVAFQLGEGFHQGIKLLLFFVVAATLGLGAYFATLLVLRAEELVLVAARLRARLQRA
jgi:putative peptidoglycan lipid II flippase